MVSINSQLNLNETTQLTKPEKRSKATAWSDEYMTSYNDFKKKLISNRMFIMEQCAHDSHSSPTFYSKIISA